MGQVCEREGGKPIIARKFEDLPSVSGSPWIVLGGGGVKGLAHVGAWQALAEAEIRPAGIVGTSIGGLIGALGASAMGHEEGLRLARELTRSDIARVNRRALWINGIRQESVFRGDVLRDYFETLLPPAGWAALETPFLVNAVDLADGSVEWFGTGARQDVSLLDAVYASSALPIFYPPFRCGGRVFVDGGAMDSLPIQKAATEGARWIIAIDVGAGLEHDAEKALEEGLLGVHSRIFSMNAYRRRQEVLAAFEGPPVLYVRPRLEGYGTFGFEHVQYFLEEGYRAMREALVGI